jgi:hypothetical protein
VIATAGSLTTITPITVAERPKTSLGGITFQADWTGLADLYTEVSITGATASTIDAQVDTDVVRIQQDYGRAYASRSRVYVFASTSSFATGLQTIFGADPSEAQILSRAAGIYSPMVDAVAIDWQKVAGDVPLSAARHELTHRMEHQLAQTGDLPAWFNEGNARFEELTVAGNQHTAVQGRFTAASMAATGTLLSLADMTSQAIWNARPDIGGFYQYYEAAEVVRLIRDRVGTAGVVRILELVGAGVTFDDAYAAVTGETVDRLAVSLAPRLAVSAATYPGIATAPDTTAGPGMQIVFYGFPPNSLMTYSVSGGGGTSGNRLALVTPYGTASTYLDQQWQPGTYTINAVYGGGTVTATAVKR